MNIQDKINQLKTPHKFDITYHMSDETDNHVITCICFEVYTGGEMNEVAKQEFEGVPAIQRASGKESCLSMITDEYLPTFLSSIKIVEVETGDIKHTCLDNRFLSTATTKITKAFYGLWDGVFDEYIDVKDNVAKTYVDFYVVIDISATDGTLSSIFFNREAETFDSLYEYSIGCYVGICFKEKRLDGTESERLLVNSEVEDILKKHALKTNQD